MLAQNKLNYKEKRNESVLNTSFFLIHKTTVMQLSLIIKRIQSINNETRLPKLKLRIETVKSQIRAPILIVRILEYLQ